MIRTFSSFKIPGVTSSGANPGALNVEFDIPTFRQAQPAGNATLKIWGISLGDISQASNFNGRTITIWGGMAKGLPLANPSQYGILLTGTINQCFGNWQDTNQTLDFVITVLTSGDNGQSNLAGTWKQGQTLGSEAANTLLTIFKNTTITDNTSTDVKLTADEPFFYQNITQFAQVINELSIYAMGNNPTYQGINIAIKDKEIILYDGTKKTPSRAIQFIDLIGQPTWHSLYTVQFKCVLRFDLNVGDYISLPDGQQKLQAKVQSQFKNVCVFFGDMQISSVRHIGNFRQPSGDNWVTVIEAYTTDVPG